MGPSIPTVQWAQRKDKLYVTVDVQDIKDAKTNLENVEGLGVLTFSGTGSAGQQYEVSLTLAQEIDVGSSKVSVSDRHVFFLIAKPEAAHGHWARLTKDKHPSFVKCDWAKWVDEDEEDEEEQGGGGGKGFDMGGMDFSGFGGGAGGMPGMGGMGGMAGMQGMMDGLGGEDDGEGEEEEDSDNEELPDLVQ